MNETVTDTTGERRVRVGTLEIAAVLFDFVNDEVLPGTGLTRDRFWRGLEATLGGLHCQKHSVARQA